MHHLDYCKLFLPHKRYKVLLTRFQKYSKYLYKWENSRWGGCGCVRGTGGAVLEGWLGGSGCCLCVYSRSGYRLRIEHTYQTSPVNIINSCTWRNEGKHVCCEYVCFSLWITVCQFVHCQANICRLKFLRKKCFTGQNTNAQICWEPCLDVTLLKLNMGGNGLISSIRVEQTWTFLSFIQPWPVVLSFLL